jgi:hypothetical protein
MYIVKKNVYRDNLYSKPNITFELLTQKSWKKLNLISKPGVNGYQLQK